MRVECPLCKSLDGRHLKDRKFYECTTCKLVWNAVSEVTDYSLGADARWIEKRKEIYRWLNRLTTEMILKRINANNYSSLRVLSIGAGKNQFILRQIREKFCDWDLVGTDFYTADDMAEAWRYRIELINVSENLYAWVTEEKFDLVICSHTMEHILDLSTFISNIAKVLKGAFFGVVPSFFSFDWDILEKENNLEHVQMFHKKSIEYMAKKLSRPLVEFVDRDVYDCFFQIGSL